MTGNRKFGKGALKFARGITSRLIKQRNTRGKTASREAKKKKRKKNCKEKVTFEQLRRSRGRIKIQTTNEDGGRRKLVEKKKKKKKKNKRKRKRRGRKLKSWQRNEKGEERRDGKIGRGRMRCSSRRQVTYSWRDIYYPV